jgi:hypothetical protein
MAGGVHRAGRTTVVEADGIDVADMAANPRDAQYVEGRTQARDEILIAFGTPLSRLGDASGSTFANAEVDDLVFWDSTMISHCGLIARPLDRLDGDPNTFVAFDFSGVPALQLPFREPRVDDPALDQFWMPVGMVSIGADLSAEERERLREIDQSADEASRERILRPVSGGQYPATIESEVKESTSDAELEAKRRAAFLRAHERRLKADERALEREMRRFFARQERVIIAKLSGPKAAGVRVEGGRRIPRRKALDAAAVFDVAHWNRQLAEDLRGFLLDVYQDWGQATIDAILGEGEKTATKAEADPDIAAVSFNLNDPEVQALLGAQVNRVVAVNDETFSQIAQAIADGTAAGESTAEIAARIRDVFAQASRYRSLLIARTEIASAANGALFAGAVQSGVATHKVWLTAADDRVRDTHGAAAGQTVLVSASFVVGGASLRYPGDSNGPAKEVINCRCTQSFTVAGSPFSRSAI